VAQFGRINAWLGWATGFGRLQRARQCSRCGAAGDYWRYPGGGATTSAFQRQKPVSDASTCWSSTASTTGPCRSASARIAWRGCLARVHVGIALNEHTDARGELVFLHACRMGLEGIVWKRLAHCPHPPSAKHRRHQPAAGQDHHHLAACRWPRQTAGGAMTGRRFPPPWTVVEHRESFWVQDASGQTVDGSISATTKKPARQAKAGQGAHRDEAADGCTRCSTSVAPTVPAGSSEFGCRIREPAHEPRAIPHLDLVALPQFQGLGDRIVIARDLDIDRAQEVAIPADEIDPVIRHGSAPQPRIRTCPERRGWLALCVTRPAACRQALADRLR
jgi:hypothetical protein